MRVLRVDNLQFEEFHSLPDDDYAILSHVWGEEEISHLDMKSWSQSEPFSIAGKEEASAKLRGCRRQACEDGLKYLWIDTCCIDKANYTELSEAINSMFFWYQKARVCYAYLSDVASLQDLATSSWFTRGWTLQELLAPRIVAFFDRNWNSIGFKDGLASAISEITNIPRKFLDGVDLEQASIAQRMSWISQRSTSKEEDLAYCLFGIFDVRMPLLYGERLTAAFRRLQLEILQVHDDTSIFAWEPPRKQSSWPITTFGLLAPTPALFRVSHDIVADTLPVVEGHTEGIRAPILFNNKGLHLSLPIVQKPDRQLLAVLGCSRAGDRALRCTIWLQDISTNGGRYARVGNLSFQSPGRLEDDLHFERLTTETRLFRRHDRATETQWSLQQSLFSCPAAFSSLTLRRSERLKARTQEVKDAPAPMRTKRKRIGSRPEESFLPEMRKKLRDAVILEESSEALRFPEELRPFVRHGPVPKDRLWTETWPLREDEPYHPSFDTCSLFGE